MTIKFFADKAWETIKRGAVDMSKSKRLTGFAHSKAFEIRKALLEELKEKATTDNEN